MNDFKGGTEPHNVQSDKHEIPIEKKKERKKVKDISSVNIG